MKKTKLYPCLAVLALIAGSVAADSANADENTGFGPPQWVKEAWEAGNLPPIAENGPPAWVVEAWQNGERPGRPPWFVRHAIAEQLGLPGPPPEVIEAWGSGAGFDLPGPPDFVLDLLGL